MTVELRRRRAHLWVLLVVAILLPLVVARMGGGTTSAALPTATVTMLGGKFTPESITVSVGDTVEWVNDDSAPHTSTHVTDWHSGLVSPGESFTRTFDAEGTYEYYCTIHAGMTGTVTVVGSGTPLPAPTATPTPPISAPGDSTPVDIFDFGYNPSSLTVAPGTTVMWTNTGLAPHTVTDWAGGFHSSGIAPGGQWSWTFDSEGTYQYYCTYHAAMTATVVVATLPPDSGTPSPTPAAASQTPTATATPPVSGSGSVGVDVGDNFFSPTALDIPAGTTVRWTWLADSFHTVTSAGAFDSGIREGGTFEHTFVAPGTYQVRCVLHTPMTMTINVTGTAPTPAPGASPTATPVPTATATPAPPPPPGSVGVDVGDNFFSPTALDIPAGTTVRWTWLSDSFHTVTSAGLFDTSIKQGGTFEYQFDVPGQFQVRCVLHAPMTMTVNVTGTAPTPDPGAPPTATPVPTSTPTPPPPPPPGSVGVDVGDNFFDPASLDIPAGTTVRWTWLTDSFHTVTSAGLFDTSIKQGGTFEYQFDAPGQFQVLCQLHTSMVMSVNVTGTAPTPDPNAKPTATPVPTATPAPPPPPPAGATVVEVKDNVFSPDIISINAGDPVQWKWVGSIPHTVTARNGVFDSGIQLSGATFSWSWKNAGTYEVFCQLHTDMVLSVAVAGGGTPGNEPTATPVPATATPAQSTATPLPSTAPSATPSQPAGGSTESTPTPAATAPTADLPAGGPAQPASSSSNPAVPSGQSPLAAGDILVALVDYQVLPSSLTVAAGSKVTWINNGQVTHSATSVEGLWDGETKPGQTFSWTFSTPGTYAYGCKAHAQMTGVITVTGDRRTTAPSDNVSAAAPDASQSGRAHVLNTDLLDNTFGSPNLRIGVGTTVRWMNKGALPHTVADRAGSFGSGILMAADSFAFTFKDAGKFEIVCSIHPEMVGSVTVLEDGGDVPKSTNEASAVSGGSGVVAGVGIDTSGENGTNKVVLIIIISTFVLAGGGAIAGLGAAVAHDHRRRSS